MNNLIKKFNETDRRLAGFMASNGIKILRLSIGVVFVWYGVLNFFPDVSSAENIATQTIEKISFGYLEGRHAMLVLAIWETLIGVGLLFGIFLRETLLLLFLQMAGTFTPLFFFPAETFSIFPWVPTLEGQYIIKNLVLISAGIVIGSTVRGGRLISEPAKEDDNDFSNP